MLSGCKSLFTREGNLLSDAKQAEKRGDYYTAVISVIESVKIDNEYKKAIEFLKETYPRANTHYALEIDKAISARGPFFNDKVALYYKYLLEMNESARTLPPVIDPDTKTELILTYTDYSAELNAANEAAAADHYAEGVKFLGMKGRENAKTAAEEFEKALGYIPGYRDAEAKIDSALDQATQILAFFPFVNNAWNIPTAQFADIMESAIVSDLMSNPGVMKYTRIIDKGSQQKIMEEQAGSLNAMMDDQSRVEIGQLLNANIIVTGTIDSAFLEGPSTSMTQSRRTAEIEVEQTETGEENSGFYKDGQTSTLESESGESGGFYKDDTSSDQSSDVTVYGTREVYADIFHYRKSITFEVTISYRAVDVETGAILRNDTIHILNEDYSEWAEWSGNEEALTWEDKLLIDTFEESIMSARQLASDAAEKAGIEIAIGLAGFLK